jgi:multiple sugar transport system permease protein
MRTTAALRSLKQTSPFSIAVFLGPYFLLFFTFIVVAVVAAVGLSFTYFNTIQAPTFIGVKNYVDILTRDAVFMQYVLPNTFLFVLVVGPGGYLLAFVLAWSLAQIPHQLRTVMAVVIYAPSMVTGVTISVVWRVFFSGDVTGYLNNLLLSLGWIQDPIQWLQSPSYLMPIMILVSLWGSMGVGFLAMLSGILNINQELFEAAYIDGIKNKFQEVFYITIPSMKPQMLFGAVMAIVGTFRAGAIGVQLSGANPTPQYAGQLIVNHIDDFGFIRYEMGYAAALSVVLLLIVLVFSKTATKYLQEKA